MDQSRRINDSNSAHGIEIVRWLKPTQVYVYAVSREPWLGHVMMMGYHENAPQLVEARKRMAHCTKHRITSNQPSEQAELFLSSCLVTFRRWPPESGRNTLPGGHP